MEEEKNRCLHQDGNVVLLRVNRVRGEGSHILGTEARPEGVRTACRASEAAT